MLLEGISKKLHLKYLYIYIFIFLLSRVVFNEVVQTSKYYMRDVTAVESSWLVELAPHFYKQAKVGQRKKLQLVIVWLEPQLDCYV